MHKSLLSRIGVLERDIIARQEMRIDSISIRIVEEVDGNLVYLPPIIYTIPVRKRTPLKE